MTARMPIAIVEERLTAAFMRAGASREAGASTARALVAAEADGLASHGLSRVPTYLAMLMSGKVDGAAVPTAARPRPGVLAIDAAHGFAYPAIDLAIAEAPGVTRALGVAAVAINRSNHCGAAGLHVERLAEGGLLALMVANAPAAMAPWGGRRPVFGTNPLAFAAPLEGRPPIVIDMALSKVARGHIVLAAQRGEPIPEGWALDAQGQPTTDAKAALKGTMIPLGDAKGAALALMVEILSAALVGAVGSPDATSFLDAEGGPPGTGQLILTLDPDGFAAGFGERMAALAEEIEGQDGARLPGSRRLAARERAKRDGVVVPPEVAARFV